jgi:hypothetical protein
MHSSNIKILNSFVSSWPQTESGHGREDRILAFARSRGLTFHLLSYPTKTSSIYTHRAVINLLAPCRCAKIKILLLQTVSNFSAALPSYHFALISLIKTKTKLHGLSPRANYTDRETAACWRSDCQLVRIEGATWSAWRIPTAVFSVFLDRSRYFFFQVAPQLYSRDWVDPVPDPLLYFFFGSAGNRTRASVSVAKNSDH